MILIKKGNIRFQDINSDNSPIDPKLRELYPELTDEQLREAEETLRQYLDLCIRIFERLEKDPIAYAEFEKEVRTERVKRGSRDSKKRRGSKQLTLFGSNPVTGQDE